MKKSKKQSKRITTRQRVKQEKKLREHNRKVRRDKRKNPKKYAKSKKDPGVPSICPFKEQVLLEAEQIRALKAEEKTKRRDKAKEMRREAKAKALEATRSQGLAGLVASAEQKQIDHDAANLVQAELKNKVSDRSAKAFYKEFLKVFDSADVLLEVLDARDPLGSRCTELENMVLNCGSSKRLVLVLNKADLVPRDNLTQWLNHLRSELPTIAFKSSTQAQSVRLGQSGSCVETCSDSQLASSKCIGATTLMSLLNNYCRNKNLKTSIRVGVVGLPNVGKSSLINSLKRSRACGVGSTPGVTKTRQEIQLDTKITLIDCPGMILASGSMSDASVALRNAVKVDSLDDPITPATAILQRCPKQHLMLRYNLSNYDSPEEFLCLLGRAIGKLMKGGSPNQEMAARRLLNDWNRGKIRYFTHPPQSRSAHISAEVVSQFSKEFDLHQLDQMEADELTQLPFVSASQTVLVDSSGAVSEVNKEEHSTKMDLDDSDLSDSDSEQPDQLMNRTTVLGAAKPKKSKKQSSSVPEQAKFQEAGLLRLKKVGKIREKKERKERRRRDKVACELSNGLEAALSGLTD